jgi:hypothetical protein
MLRFGALNDKFVNDAKERSMKLRDFLSETKNLRDLKFNTSSPSDTQKAKGDVWPEDPMDWEVGVVVKDPQSDAPGCMNLLPITSLAAGLGNVIVCCESRSPSSTR